MAGDDARPPINREAAMTLVDGDEELFLEIAGMFESDAKGYMEKILAGLAAGDMPAVEKNAHTLKGSAANICATPFKEAAAAVEQAARAGDAAKARACFRKLVEEFKRLAITLREILRR